jgi:hypothetical protein
VVSNLSWTGHVRHEDVACLDSSMWHHGICRDLSMGPPFSSLSYVLNTDESQPLDRRMDRSPPYILEREDNSGLRDFGDIVDMYKNNEEPKARYSRRLEGYSL